ncbi:MAG TPA: M67 family metallopeptidase [Limnochordia bacterium]|nr:M67 family metallopeptidase [Limnochordia bacterium]
MIIIAPQAFEAMLEHARATFPEECCGLMVGRFGEAERHIVRVSRARNLNTERAHDRFELDPADFLRVQRTLVDDEEIVGFYHSHPDHPPKPSPTDTARAFPVYSYIIIGVQHGRRTLARSWRYDEGRAAFTEEVLVVTD